LHDNDGADNHDHYNNEEADNCQFESVGRQHADDHDE
jgi:hypothetical protein